MIMTTALLLSLSGKAQVAVVSSNGSKNCDVGEIPVEYSLTPSGAVSYTVPIDVHPDTEGFQPRLSFMYNSQQHETALGYGWNIGGLSGITHVAGSIYYDGKATPLSLKDDKLMLDGMRLIKTGTDTWQSEQGFIRVNRESENRLKVYYPDGNTAVFENSPQAPFSYVITSYTNRKGRSIQYTYMQADNLPYIRTIRYGEAQGVYNDSIVFNYHDVPSGIIRYADGKAFKYSKLLESVSSFYKGNLWRRYRISYQNRGVYLPDSLECETSNHRLNPLRFGYGNGRSIEFLSDNTHYLSKYFHNSQQEQTGYSSLAISRGKFSKASNSDGLITYPIPNQGEYHEAQELLVYKDLSDMFIEPVVFTAGKGFKQLEAIDIDGNGVDELVKINYIKKKKLTPPTIQKDTLKAAIYDSQINPARHTDYAYPEQDGYVHERQCIFGDFNGDGKVELLAISSCYNPDLDKYPSRALLVDLDNRKTLYDNECFDFTLYPIDASIVRHGDRLIPMDYNGDGKTDICLININGTYVYEFTGNGFKQLAYSNALKITAFNFEEGSQKDRELMLADMNADGNLDIILGPNRVHCKEGYKHFDDGICYGACNNENNLKSTSASGYKYYKDASGAVCHIDPHTPDRALITSDSNVKNGKQWLFLMSTGNSSYSAESPGFKVHTEELFYCFYETVGLNFMLVDVDSDGLPDLLRNQRGKVDVYLNENGKISQTPNMRSTQYLDNLTAQFAVANVAQSYYWSGGLICVDNEKLHVYNYSHNEQEARMLHNLTDSYGVNSNHAYVDIMTTNATRYVQNPGAIQYIGYPYTIMNPHLFVPAWIKNTENNQTLSWEYYKYTNAVFHRTGMGFRGFQQIETEDMVNDRTMISTYNIELLGSEVEKSTPTDTITRIYDLKRESNRIALLTLKQETTENVLNKTTTIGKYEYNDYGQMLHSSVSSGHYTEQVSYSYRNVDDGSLYLLGIQDSVETRKLRDDSLFIKTIHIGYDDRYLPVSKIERINGKKSLQEKFEYDTQWQMTSHSQCNYESDQWLTTQFEYNDLGQLVKETDPMGFHVTHRYDEATGLPLSDTDHKGRATRYEYDEWGNLLKTTYPDGRKKQTGTTWSRSEEPGLFCVTAAETGKPLVKTYYDALKREVRTATTRFDGKELKTDKVYDTKTGLLVKESLPDKDSIPTLWNQYTYDRYDRKTSTRYASGKVDSCAYGALTDTLTENGIRHIRQYSADGLMTSAADEGGNIAYFYRADGQPLVIVASDSVQTRFYYDVYGRRTAIKDPSAGIRRTEYDKDGNVCRETDADGRQVVREYDRYGRITRLVHPDFTTIYTYAKDEDLLLSAVSDNGTATYYTYDAYGRVENIREEAPEGYRLEKTYGYTEDGMLSTISYSSQYGKLCTEQLVYRNGTLTGVYLDDGTCVYSYSEEDRHGQLTRIATGEYDRRYEYDEWGFPTARRILYGDGKVLMDQRYEFDAATGNLKSRQDALRNRTELFEYDALQRLTLYAGKKVEYTPDGNIVRKGDAGEMVYTNPNRPYSVTGNTPEKEACIHSGLQVGYTAADRPAWIEEGSRRAEFTYNALFDRVRMKMTEEGKTIYTKYYLGGNYEAHCDSSGTEERLYVGGDCYEAPALFVKKEGKTDIRFLHRDYLGSILQVADNKGNIIEENSFDAWGSRRDPDTQEIYTGTEAPSLMTGRGFTGHEHLDGFGLIHMNARLYDPILGRFLSPDPYVQLPDFTQAMNRYGYCMNRPLCYVDKNGEFFFGAFLGPIGALLDGMCWGAVIGAGTSAVTYTLSTLVFGQKWDNGNFWKSVGMGAVGGAIGGGLGHIGGLASIGNSFGYNMLSNISNTMITNAIFGYDMEWSNILPIIGGAAVGSALPNFKGIKGSKFMNGLAEIGYNTLRGTATGLAAGTINAAIKQDPNQIWQGMLGGAIGGMSRSIIMNMLFGAPYQVGNTYGVEGLYRSGGIADFIDKLIEGAGITLGRNIHVQSDLDEYKLEHTKYHENYHIQQQNQIGWANFYGRTLYEYMRYGVRGMTSVYYAVGTLEKAADDYADFQMSRFKY